MMHHHYLLCLLTIINKDLLLFINITVQQYNFKKKMMNYDTTLYRQYIENKQNSRLQIKRQILKQFVLYPNQLSISLNTSIDIMRAMGILKIIESVQHITSIMDRKRQLGNQWKSQEQELAECRLLYFLWAVIDEQNIQMQQFKEIIRILMQTNINRSSFISQIYGQKQGIQELIQMWDKIMSHSEQIKNIKSSKYNCSDNSQQIDEISIIKTKNEAINLENKENYPSFAFNSIKTQRKNTISNKSQNQFDISQEIKLKKSFSKRKNSTRDDKYSSVGKSVCKKSNQMTPLSHFVQNCYISNRDNLSLQESRQLIDRLYHNYRYRERQQLKKALDQQRLKEQMKNCTFKPNIVTRNRQPSQGHQQAKNIKGFDKSIERIKNGHKKAKQLQQHFQYRVWRQNKQPSQSTWVPKFQNRQKKQTKELFQIIFTIGRHKIPIKVRQSDRIDNIVSNITKIYSLKQEFKKSIRATLKQEIDKFYEQTLKQTLNDEQ